MKARSYVINQLEVYQEDPGIEKVKKIPSWG